jgi:predicted transcriptional regulator
LLLLQLLFSQMAIHALLRDIGFTDYEARAYVSLLGSGVSNGYEVAKAAAMPRANTYAVLERLVERGAAQRLDTRNGVRYVAVDPAHLTRQLSRRHRRTLAAIEKALNALVSPRKAIPVFNLKGYSELLGRARETIDDLENELLVAIQPAEAEALAEPLRDARERGVVITTLCMEACLSECGGCQGQIHSYDLAPENNDRWLLLAGDGQRAIAGEITAAGTTAIATEHHLVVELVAGYIRQSLALAIVADDLGDRFEGLLSENARHVLDSLQPGSGFLDRLARIVNSESD